MFLVVLAAAACKRESPAPAAEPVRPAPFAAGRVACAAAFDLVSTAGGPMLIWARPRQQGGALFAQSLDALGLARGASRRIAEPAAGSEVGEIAAAALDAQVGIAFIERDASETRTRALLYMPSDAQPPEPIAIAASPADRARGRGSLAATTTNGDTFRILYPAGKADCVESGQQACIGFGFRELGPGAREPGRPWLSVPQPCPEGAASVSSLPGRWFYAVCTWSHDAPSTMAYSINVDTYYARADEVLRGCTPLGMLAIDADTLLLGADCSAMRRAAQLTRDMKPATEIALDDVRVVCDGERASISATGWSLVLDTPRDRLEVVLPAAIAPTGSRAIWTGVALLVAHRQNDALELRRYVCARGSLHVEHSGAAAPAGK